MTDIQHPDYYFVADTEVIDIIEDVLTDEEYMGFCKGDIIKYALRRKNADERLDLVKLRDYANLAIGKIDKMRAEKEIERFTEQHDNFMRQVNCAKPKQVDGQLSIPWDPVGMGVFHSPAGEDYNKKGYGVNYE